MKINGHRALPHSLRSVQAGAGALFLALITLATARNLHSQPVEPSRPPAAADCQQGAQNEKELARLEAQLAKAQEEIESQVLQEVAEIQERVAEQVGRVKPKMEAQLALLQQRMAGLESVAAEKSAQALEKSHRAWELVNEEEGGWLGIEIAEVTPEKAKELHLDAARGVIVKEVTPDSPAAKAGLKENDVIVEYNGERVEGALQFGRLVRETPSGRTVALTTIRDGKPQKLNAEIGAWSDHFGKEMNHVFAIGPPPVPHVPDMNAFDFRSFPYEFGSAAPLLGVTAENLNGQLGEYFGAPGGQGVLVREVRPGTPAEKAGLKAGDVIVKVDGESIRTVGDLRSKLRARVDKDEKNIQLGVLRKGSQMTLSVSIEKPKPIELLGTQREQI